MVEADLAREYGLTAEQLAAASTRRFLVLVGGLPAEAKFPRLWARTPRAVTDPREIAALTGAPVP
ncbi:hypothetical protein [Streptomyces sp. Da 82-17]|uniref:hypothetical protein n=1 Tax=Streptomyces sp. Da 82-17 TaxID=3377116 RepID=UPI0038D515F0